MNSCRECRAELTEKGRCPHGCAQASPESGKPFETRAEFQTAMAEATAAFHVRLSHTSRCIDSSEIDCICGLTELRTGLQRIADTARLAFERAPSEGRGPQDDSRVREIRQRLAAVVPKSFLVPVSAITDADADFIAHSCDDIRYLLAALPSPVSDPTDTKLRDTVAEDLGYLIAHFGHRGFAFDSWEMKELHVRRRSILAAIDAARRPQGGPMSNTVRSVFIYGDWTIQREHYGDLAYVGTHKDYDGAPINSQSDDCPDQRCFHGPSIQAVLDQIKEYEEEAP